MARLNEPVQLFIVEALACFDTPSQVAAAVKETFGLEITRQQVAAYDPTKTSGRDLSRKLRAIFEKARQAFLENVGEIPIAKQAFRLRALQRMFERAEAQGNIALAASFLEQAAKEVGGILTNRREMTGAQGAPLAPPVAAFFADAEEFRRIAQQVASEV